jgi:hypothetical protein
MGTETFEMNAYDTALEYLLAGAMPVIVDSEDGLHVLACKPTNRIALVNMIDPDERSRLKYITQVIISVKQHVGEAV